VATGAQSPTISKEMIHTKKPLLILDLSIPKNVAFDVTDLPNVSLVHLDQLSQITDDNLERRKQFIPEAEAIIEHIKDEFIQWLETRKFAPVIKALKKKLKTMKDEELNFQSKKLTDFNSVQADIVSERIIQKITKQFANHLKGDDIDADNSLALIQKVFQLELETK
jgi:glutamyl-tRNA reductase